MTKLVRSEPDPDICGEELNLRADDPFCGAFLKCGLPAGHDSPLHGTILNGRDLFLDHDEPTGLTWALVLP